MKKLLIFALLLALVMALPAVANAQESVQDSSYIEPEILAQMNTSGADQVVKVFHVDIMHGFSFFDSIETVIDQYQWKAPCYLVLSGSAVLRYYQPTQEGGLELLEGSGGYSPLSIQEYVNHGGLNRLGEGVEVQSTYLLCGGSCDGTAVYYETNQGTYVYFNGPGFWSGYSSKEYLMPLNIFSFQSQKRAEYAYIFSLYGASGSPVYPMSGYEGFDIHAEDFDMRFRPDPWSVAMWIVAIVIGGSALLVTHLIKKRRSLRQQEGPRMKPDPTPRYAYCFHIL